MLLCGRNCQVLRGISVWRCRDSVAQGKVDPFIVNRAVAEGKAAKPKTFWITSTSSKGRSPFSGFMAEARPASNRTIVN